MSILSKIFGDANERYIKSLQPIVDRINAFEPEFEKMSREDLRAKTEEFKNRLSEGETLDDILPEAFAAVREAAKRTLGQRHFDVQIMGGIVLHQGKIAEMKTGEGKTLVATLPSYLNALTGKGVHIVTVNDYLSRRDAVWMGQIYHFLGLTVGCLNHEQSFLYDPLHIGKTDNQENGTFKSQFPISNKISNPNDQNNLDETRDTLGSFKVVADFLRPVSRREAYAADVVYGTNNEFGFDYLRDNMVYRLEDMVQRGFYYAIVDEVDSILIDEARTPLIISAPDEESNRLYQDFARIIPRLEENVDYNIDEKMRAATLTDKGIEKVEKILGMNIYNEGGIRYVHHLEQALKAHTLFKRDRDYVVKEGEVIIVDEFTGRLMPGRRYSEGLHQAIEAKEGVQVKKESRTLATITFQNYFRMYEKLAGMTGTAATSAEEFYKVYKLEVVIIPTNRPMVRQDHPDNVYKTEKGKFAALTKEIAERHKKGQPVLCGTISIEKNEKLSAYLRQAGIPHEILNAKHHEREGAIIAQAGRLGAVTIATNMAGRGVDIILGGNPPDPAEAKKVREVGGLYVIGTERHEARRIDNQLRGRSGRQGDPGESRFFVSLEDDLMRIFGSERIKRMMETFHIPEDQPISHPMVTKAIGAAQAKIEGFNFDLRKHILEYDDVMNIQRATIYRKRREILEAENLKNEILEMITKEISAMVDFHTAADHPDDWNIEEICENIKTLFPAPTDLRSKIEEFVKLSKPAEEIREDISGYLTGLAKVAYEEKEKELGEENMRQIEKILSLRTIDMLWMDHLENMEYLRDSVRLRAYGQRDPLVEYKNEGHRLFKTLLGSIEANIVGMIFKVGLVKPPSTHYHQPSAVKKENTVVGSRSAINGKIGRNDPCWCGSGKKFKKCHG